MPTPSTHVAVRPPPGTIQPIPGWPPTSADGWQLLRGTHDAVTAQLARYGATGDLVQQSQALPVPGQPNLFYAYTRVVQHAAPAQARARFWSQRRIRVTAAAATILVAAAALAVWWIVANVALISGAIVVTLILGGAVTALRMSGGCPGCLCGTCPGGH